MDLTSPPTTGMIEKKRCRLQLSQMYLFNVFHPTTHKSSQPHWKNFLTHSFQTRSAPRLPSSTKTRTIADNTTAIIPTVSIHYTMMRERDCECARSFYTFTFVPQLGTPYWSPISEESFAMTHHLFKIELWFNFLARALGLFAIDQTPHYLCRALHRTRAVTCI